MAKPRIIHKKQEKPSFWARYKLKIASTLLAIFIWFLVVTGGTFTHIVTVPITTPQSSATHIITNEIPKRARIRVRSNGTSLMGFLIFREASLYLDFPWQVGTLELHPDKDNVLVTGNAKNINVLELISPKTIVLNIEDLVEKEVPVKPGFTLKTQPGYTIVGDIELTPSRIKIRGAKSIVDTCQYVETEDASWDNLKRPLRNRIDLKEPSFKTLILLENKVQVFADIQKLMEKQIERVPIKVINLPPQTKAIVVPSTLSLVVEGGVNVVSKVTTEDIVATIDYQKYEEPQDTPFPVSIEPLPEIRFRDIKPQKFKIVLERQ
ncbi:hypothetical protein GF406_07845 [candidate division KSB1 bacterium]|nr:hypothetical protein [candidate division KSB1 bacterium]